MTKLEQLIKELCPNGVDYIPINKCIEKTEKINWKSETNSFQYIDLTSVDRDTHLIEDTITINAENAPSRAQQIVLKNDILLGTTRPMLKRYCIIPADYNNQICSTGFCVLRAKTSVVLTRWLFYNISSTAFFVHVEKNQQGASYPAIAEKDVKSFKIPVPPLEVQAEIVKILDEYTECVTALQQELENELTARKKQYEYYRDLLLDFGGSRQADAVHGGGTSECEWRTLGTVIISLKTGLNPRQNFSLNENGSNLPYITGKDIYDNAINVTERTDRITTDALTLINKRANLESGLLLFASTGTGTVGRMAIIQEYNNDWGISETLYAIKVNENIILTSFLLHYLYSASAKSQFEPKISKGSVPHLKVKDLENVKVPIISIEEQTRIVNILDRFDKLCNDISEGLPAEIEARRKQYEYYRDKLLSFEERKNA